jgi:predicted O-methyltransferase YrrM
MPRPMSAEDWPPATFTAPIRGNTLGHTAAERLQKTAAHEASIAFRITKAVSRVPIVGRLIGVPRDAPGQWKPVADRTAEVERIRRAPLYRRIESLRSSDLYERLWRSRVRGEEPPATPPPAPTAEHAPAAEPLVTRFEAQYVDEALEFLRRVPFQELQRRGWHLQPNHYYWPLNDVRFLREHEDLWHDRGLPRGIDWDLDGQVAFARELATVYHELDDVEHEGSRNALAKRITFDNGSFSGADACAYYGVVRTRQPRRVVEVGGGWSTIFLAHALARNDRPAAVTLIEPEPDPRLLKRLPHDWDIQKSLLQFADLTVFERLEAGDVCFYDGSHVARTGSDVNWFFFEVLPRLAPGVLIHVHDISGPTTTTTSGSTATG